MHSAGDLFICLGDFNVNIGGDINGLYVIYEWYGVGKRNFVGRILLELCL